MTNHDAQYWVGKLGLLPHPEGGYYRETYRSHERIIGDALPNRYNADRSYCTAIYFLIEAGNFSALHRIKSDEMWHFYGGDPLSVHVISDDGTLEEIRIGDNPDRGETFQAVVKGGTWFGSRVATGGKYSLVGCTVAPGFDFDDFEMGDREDLLTRYPQHAKLIGELTRL